MIVETEEDRQEVIKMINSWSLKHPMEVIGRKYKKDRSRAQNAMAAVWFRDIGKQTEHGEEYERCTCKLLFGVPIMMRHDFFVESWEPYSKLPYERQLRAMKVLDVTSLMSMSEMTEFLYSVENHAHDNGFQLTKPKTYDEAMNQ